MSTQYSYECVLMRMSPIYPKGAADSAHSMDMRYSLNSSPPHAAARITACTPDAFKIEVKIEVYASYISYIGHYTV